VEKAAGKSRDTKKQLFWGGRKALVFSGKKGHLEKVGTGDGILNMGGGVVLMRGCNSSKEEGRSPVGEGED